VRRITQASRVPIVRLDFIAATPCEPVAVGWSLYAGWLIPTRNYLKLTKTRCDVKIESCEDEAVGVPPYVESEPHHGMLEGDDLLRRALSL
jgi:hypothetical protein